MKLRWYLLIGLFIGLLSVPFIRNIKGSTYILFDKTAIEFQNYFAVTLLVVGLLVLWGAWLLLRYLLRTSNKTLGWFGGRKSNKARQQTIDGMIALAEGHWQTAEKLLVKSANTNDTQLINYLAAARAAQQQGDQGQRDHYLQLAAKAEPDAQIAVGLTQVELQLDNRQYENALATLNHLRQLSPHHPYVLKLLQRLHLELADWQALSELMPKLRKQRVLTEKDIAELETKAWSMRIEQAAKQDLTALEQLWQQTPKTLRKEGSVLEVYLQALVDFGQFEVAESQIRQTLKRQWSDSLTALYGQIKAENPAKQLAHAEHWLKQQAHNPQLLNCLGKLSLNAQLWGKAKSYAEQSLAAKPSTQAYFLLAQAFEKLGHPINAQEMYQQGLAFQVNSEQMLSATDPIEDYLLEAPKS